jgi:UDP-glucose 4-epimerase
VEAALNAGVERLIFTSSVAVYGPGGPYSEADACRPLGPYAQSKHAAELYAFKAHARGLRTTVLRLGMIYGMAPVMRFDAVANRFAYLAGVQRPLTVYGDGRQRRPFLHARDASAALLHVLHRPSEGDEAQLFNVVGDNVSVLDLVRVIEALQPGVGVRYSEQDIRTHYSFGASGERFHRYGWRPQVTLEAGLGEIIQRFSGLKPARNWMTDLG